MDIPPEPSKEKYMQLNTRTALAPILAVGLIAAVATSVAAEQTWRVQNGTVTVSLFRQIIRGCQLDLVNLNQTASPRGDMEEAVGFAINKSSDLEFTALGGGYRHFNSGGVKVHGGFDIKGKDGTLSVQNFTVAFRETGTHDNLFVYSGNNPDAPADFDLSHIKVMFDRNEKTLLFGYADMIINERGAKKLGRPDMAGQVIGGLTVGAATAFVGGDPKDPAITASGNDGGGGVNGNVMLFNLGDCASYGRVGTFPNGISGLGLATTSCNVSTITQDNVNWFDQMDERHPVIAQNFYRLRTIAGAGTRFEQIGIGWVKHGFLSTNSNGCGQCQTPPLGGSQLGVNCSDTYGSQLNASRSWLGPRNEVNVFTGKWKCLGSYFANYQNDCVERFSTSGLSPVDHRLQVLDQDLLTTNSQYFYEAYYVSENDIDRYNNAAWRPVNPVWSAVQSKFNFSPTATQTQGVRIQTWGDIQPAPVAMPDDEGDILVAVEVTDMGGGNWHYEYVVYNHTSNREARTFSVPLPDGAVLSNIGFRDVDTNPGNDWRAVVTNGAITWSTDTYATDPNANSLKWFTLYNFRFDANVAPMSSKVGNVLFRPGTMQSIAADSRVPTSPQVLPASFILNRGSILTGDTTDLMFSDDSRLQIRPGVVLSSSQAPIQLTVEGTSPTASPTTMSLRLEHQASATALARTVEAYNYTTGQWVVVNTTTSTTTGDTLANIPVGSAAQFVQAGTRTVRMRVSYRQTGPVLGFPYTVRLDLAVWNIQ